MSKGLFLTQYSTRGLWERILYEFCKTVKSVPFISQVIRVGAMYRAIVWMSAIVSLFLDSATHSSLDRGWMSRPIRGQYCHYRPIRGWMSVSTWLDIINIVQGPTVPHRAMMIKLGQILKECLDHSLLSTDPLNDLQEAVQKCLDFWEHEGCKDIKIL